MRNRVVPLLILSGALAVAVGLTACKKPIENKPQAVAAKALLFVPGTGPAAARSALQAIGPAAWYDETMHGVRMRLDHPWFSRMFCTADRSTGVITDCLFRFRDGVVTPKNIEKIASFIETLSPAVRQRKKVDTDKLSGGYYYNFGDGGDALPASLYLEWANGEVTDANFNVCSRTGSEDYWSECKDVVQALIASALPAL